jgi:hypothetical protein
MKRLSGAMVLLAAAGGGGCMGDPGGAVGPGSYMSHAFNPGAGAAHCGGGTPGAVAGLVGPYGQPMMATAPAMASAGPPTGEALAQQVIAQSLPPELATQVLSKNAPPGGSNILLASATYPTAGGAAPGMVPPPGAVPPGGLLAPPGMPGPGQGGPPIAGAVAAVGALTNGVPAPFVAQRTSIRFAAPGGMKVSWYAPGPNGGGGFSPQSLDVPGRYNFPQAAIYRLKLSDIPDRPGLELYPTLEVVPANGKTATFLAHSSVPVSFTPEDLDQVQSGNFVVKVIYLPDPQFQDLAVVGPDEVVSSRLEPGVDPIAEAHRRGCILAVVRLGNIDLEAPNTPAMDAPSPYQYCPPGVPTAAAGPLPPGAAGRMVPYGMNGQPVPPGMMPPQGGRPGMLPAMPGAAPGPVPTVPTNGTGKPLGKAGTADPTTTADASNSRSGWSLFDSASKSGK